MWNFHVSSLIVIWFSLSCRTGGDTSSALTIGNLHFTFPREYFLDVPTLYCGRTYSPNSIAVVYSHLSASFLEHPTLHSSVEDIPTNIACTIILDSGTGSRWLVQFPVGVDISSAADCASGALYLKDGETPASPLLQSVCGHRGEAELQPKVTSGRYLTIEMKTGPNTTGHKGFKLLVSQFKDASPIGHCQTDQLLCDNRAKCVSKSFRCDGFRQCIDKTDEPEDVCKFETDLKLIWNEEELRSSNESFGEKVGAFFAAVGTTGTIFMVVGAIVIIVIITELFVWSLKKRKSRRYRRPSSPTITAP